MKNKLNKIVSILMIIIILILIILISLKFKNTSNQNNTELFYLNDKYYKKSELIEIDIDKYKKLENNKESFVIYVHIPGVCSMRVPFEPIVKEFITTNHLTFYSINFNQITESDLEDYIKYSPSIAIFNNGEMISCLDPNSNNDLEYYESLKGFSKWFTKYVKLK